MNLWRKISNFFKSKEYKRNHLKQSNIHRTRKNYDKQAHYDHQPVKEYERSLSNPKFNRSSKEENLAFNFFNRYFLTLQSLESDVYFNVNKISQIYSIEQRIKQCNKAIAAYEKLKTFCLSKGKGGQLHFEDTWEHCHSSKNPDFRFMERVELELAYLTENYQEAQNKLQKEMIKKENRKLVKEFKQHAHKYLIDIINSNNGILQTELYNYFDEIYKSVIKNTLKKLEVENKIKRVKKGNSYRLFMRNSNN